MTFSDRVSGVLTFALGLAVVIRTQSFPPMPGQPVGPAMFPMAIGAVLMIAGAVLFAGSVRQRAASYGIADWMRRPRMLINFALVIGDLLFYALVVTDLGFLITAVIFVSVLMLAFGVGRARILPLAVAVTLVIHYAFYTLLRVPLPWGVLEGIAW